MVTPQDAIILHCQLACKRLTYSQYQAYYNYLQQKFKDATNLVYFGYNRKTRQMYVKEKVPFEDMTVAMLERIVKANYYLISNSRLPKNKMEIYLKEILNNYENGYR